MDAQDSLKHFRDKFHIPEQPNIKDCIYFTNDTAMPDYLVKLVGAEKVALGTDYPFPLGEAAAGSLIESCAFDASTKAKLLHGAALKWLNLDNSSFL